jgi:hypothetical protein
LNLKENLYPQAGLPQPPVFGLGCELLVFDVVLGVFCTFAGRQTVLAMMF